MIKTLRRLSRDNSGATAIEYGLIVAFIVIGMIVALEGLASENTRIWTSVMEKSETAINGS